MRSSLQTNTSLNDILATNPTGFANSYINCSIGSTSHIPMVILHAHLHALAVSCQTALVGFVVEQPATQVAHAIYHLVVAVAKTYHEWGL